MGKIAKGVNKINFTMLYGNYCYILIENFPQITAFSLSAKGWFKYKNIFSVSATAMLINLLKAREPKDQRVGPEVEIDNQLCTTLHRAHTRHHTSPQLVSSLVHKTE